MSTNILWEKEFYIGDGRDLEITFWGDGELSTSVDIYCTLDKSETKELYLAMKDYFENEENK